MSCGVADESRAGVDGIGGQKEGRELGVGSWHGAALAARAPPAVQQTVVRLSWHELASEGEQGCCPRFMRGAMAPRVIISSSWFQLRRSKFLVLALPLY